jgi:hypothetical protein
MGNIFVSTHIDLNLSLSSLLIKNILKNHGAEFILLAKKSIF